MLNRHRRIPSLTNGGKMIRSMYISSVISHKHIYIGLKSLFPSIKGSQIVNLKFVILNLYIKNQNPHSKLMQNLLFFFLRLPLYVDKVSGPKIHFKFVSWIALEEKGSSWFESLEMTDCRSWVGINLANEFVLFQLKFSSIRLLPSQRVFLSQLGSTWTRWLYNSTRKFEFG